MSRFGNQLKYRKLNRVRFSAALAPIIKIKTVS